MINDSSNSLRVWIRPKVTNGDQSDDDGFFDWLCEFLFVYDRTLHRTSLCHSVNPTPSTTWNLHRKRYNAPQPRPSSTSTQQQNSVQVTERVDTSKKTPKESPLLHQPTHKEKTTPKSPIKPTIAKQPLRRKTNCYINQPPTAKQHPNHR